MKKHKFNHMLAVVSTMALVAGSQTVYAQQATDKAVTSDKVEEIIITGFKASLQKAAEMKKESTSIVEVVTSEDIGKLPDKSIAEALMRLPGLATQRINGRPQVISIRGMDPDYSNTLMNGRQQASTGVNRAVQYDQYPAEFTNAAVVYKTPDATVLGQGVAGTIDMRTVRPLAFGKQAIVANVRYEQNSEAALNSAATNKGTKDTLSYIDQFNDNTIGVAIGLSHTDSPTQTKKFEAWGFASVDGNAVIGGVKPFVQSDLVKRDSVIGTLEYAPSETFSTSLDVFYSKFKEDNLFNGVEIPLQWNGGTQLQQGYKVTDGVVTEGTYTGTAGIVRNDATYTKSDLYAVAWNTKFAIGDAWSGDVDISTSSAESKALGLENYSGYMNTPDTLSFVTDSHGTRFTAHQLDYSDASKITITNPQGWGNAGLDPNEGGQKSFASHPHITDDLTQIRLSASHELDWGFISKVQLGINHDERSKFSTVAPEVLYAFADHSVSGALPAKTYTTDFSYMGLGNVLSYSPLAIINDSRMRSVEDVKPSVASRTWTVDESVNTAFIKFDIKSEVGSIPLTGNIGLQLVSSDQSSDGTSSTGNYGTFQAVAQHGEASFNNVLPSLNLSFAVTEKDFLKVGMARTLTRPRMDQMQASSSYELKVTSLHANESATLENSPWKASGGNTQLKPWVADSIDLSVEHYLDDNIGYFSIATFYKYLNSYVFNNKTVMDFSDFPADPSQPTPTFYQGWNTVPTNGTGGYIRGTEFSLSLTGEVISESLRDFGVVFNASRTTSNIEPLNTIPHTLPGLSDKVQGVQFYYEAHGFSARISENYRSSFNGETQGNLGGRSLRYFDGTRLLDAQIGYTFESGALDGLGITLQGYNLNSEPSVTRVGGKALQVVDYQTYGRSYALNLNYKF